MNKAEIKIQCINCSHANEIHQKYCENCGKPIREKKTDLTCYQKSVIDGYR